MTDGQAFIFWPDRALLRGKPFSWSVGTKHSARAPRLSPMGAASQLQPPGSGARFVRLITMSTIASAINRSACWPASV